MKLPIVTTDKFGRSQYIEIWKRHPSPGMVKMGKVLLQFPPLTFLFRQVDVAFPLPPLVLGLLAPCLLAKTAGAPPAGARREVVCVGGMDEYSHGNWFSLFPPPMAGTRWAHMVLSFSLSVVHCMYPFHSLIRRIQTKTRREVLLGREWCGRKQNAISFLIILDHFLRPSAIVSQNVSRLEVFSVSHPP